MTPILQADGLTMNFNGLHAVSRFSLSLEKGKIYGLIGTNGAGKTTVINMLSGVLKPTKGHIFLEGKEITGKRPDIVSARGIARTFQNLRLFGKMTVLENVLIGAQMRKDYSFFSSSLGLRSYRENEKKLNKDAEEMLEILKITRHAGAMAASLPYGDQRRLEIARALATKPQVLLLDEPAAGMNPKESSDLMETIESIRQAFNLTILLIEHDMKVVMGLCERLSVMAFGEVIAEGLPKDIRGNQRVIEAYLGRKK